jgi:serine/threonine protein kinase
MTGLLGTRIGHYRVVDLLGEGGMGKVYVGYDEKLARKVALKSIRADHRLDDEAKARFLREARVLGQLAHPNICQIFDYIEGDVADVLVLELIPGQRLTEAMKKRMDDRQKLRIAEEIAGVLVAAHEKGIVHRDLKPDNIMLAEEGLVKVLDFGLSHTQQRDATLRSAAQAAGESQSVGPLAVDVERARDSDARHTAILPSSDVTSTSGTLTLEGAIMGTLGYMSPEQARGEVATSASDLYSFGLILHELFTGKPPYEAGLDHVIRLERVRAGQTLPAEGIDADLAALIERLKSLVMAARPSAVDTAERLAWIRNKPARRRKKLLVAAAMVVLALFGAAMTVQTLRAVRAERLAREEAATSKQVSEFLVGLFKVSDPSEARGNSVTAREILDKGAQRIETDLKDQPLVQARLMDTMGNVFVSLGLYEKAEPLLARALGTRESLLPADHPDVALSLNTMGLLYKNQGEYAKAEALYRRSLAIREKVLGADHPDVAEVLNNLAAACQYQGRSTDAEPLHRRALAIREKALGPEHPDVATSLNNLAWFHQSQGQYTEAEPLYKRALAIWEKASGQDHPDLAISVNNLAALYYMQGKYAAAEPLFRRSLALKEKALGPEHPDVATSLNNLAMLSSIQGDNAAAEPLLVRALAIREKAFGADHPDVATALNNLGMLFYENHQYTKAEPMLKRSLAIREKALGPSHPEVGRSLHNIGLLYRDQKRYGESAESFKRALAIYDRATKANPKRVAETLNEYAKLLRATNNAAEAEKFEAQAKALTDAQK